MLLDVRSITLAAGASSRMPTEMRPKACCRIGAVSVIENALDSYEQAGIYKHLVVVGRGAERLMSELGAKRRDILYAFQGEPRGTGDAVRCALDLLASVGAPEHVLISAGDKVIAPHVIRGLVETFEAAGADFCLVAGRSSDYPGSGRIILRETEARAIIEVPDIRVRQLVARLRNLPPAERPATVEALAALAAGYLPNRDKLATCFPAMGRILSASPGQPVAWDTVAEAAAGVPESFTAPGGDVTLDEAAEAPLCNLSIYLGRYAAIRSAVEQLRANNVQREWYLTDIVQILSSQGGSVRLFRTQEPEEVMAFNTVEDLEEVRKVYALRAALPNRYPLIEVWGQHFARRGETGLAPEAVRRLGAEIGVERPCILVHSPGRINLMGRHIDHQGGTCNLMAIDQEIVLAASPREDDVIHLWNASARDYPHRTFTFKELMTDIVWGDWLRTLNSQFVQRYVSSSAGDWVNYAKGAALRLQHRFRDRKLRGMDAFVCGNIPTGAGLSSSSALVVAVAEALVELNALNVGVKEFIDLCGEGEWFVGTRGGSADHAAIKYSRENEVVTVSFFPFEVIAHHPFPRDCRLVIAYSGVSARKTQNARARFNSRVACYHMAREILKRNFPHLSPLIDHLRDINTARLDISLPALYRLLKEVPTTIEPRRIEAMAAEHATVAKCITGINLAEHDFPLRDVTLYGLAECERGAKAGDLLQRGDADALGRMMNISHDGDRVAQWRPHQNPFENSATDGLMDDLIRRSSALEALSKQGAALWQQPGAYDCSMPEIDLMADRALECPGVLGAQIAGAGLGGCIMILVRREAVQAVREKLLRDYYLPHEIEPQVIVCQASRGSQVLTTVEAER